MVQPDGLALVSKQVRRVTRTTGHSAGGARARPYTFDSNAAIALAWERRKPSSSTPFIRQ
jgi:hypothetical protein